MICLSILCLFVFILLVVPSASWVCGLVSHINWTKFPIIIASLLLPFLSLSLVLPVCGC